MGRRKYNELVRALVAFMRKRDPRIQRIEGAQALRQEEAEGETRLKR